MFFGVKQTKLPSGALLETYASRAGHYTDCYTIDISERVNLADYVEAFYTSWLFKLERWILSWLANRPSTDQEALALSLGKIKSFAAWNVEARKENELLMCDMSGRTRSWFRIENSSGVNTRLFFGSAVVPKEGPNSESPNLGFIFKALLGFHKLYSRALLSLASSKLTQ